MRNVKGVVRSDELSENHHLTLQFPSSLLSILASFALALTVRSRPRRGAVFQPAVQPPAQP